MLTSAIQPHKSAVIIYVSPPSWASLPSLCPHSSRSASLCYTAASNQLPILHTTLYIYTNAVFSIRPTQSFPTMSMSPLHN